MISEKKRRIRIRAVYRKVASTGLHDVLVTDRGAEFITVIPNSALNDVTNELNMPQFVNAYSDTQDMLFGGKASASAASAASATNVPVFSSGNYNLISQATIVTSTDPDIQPTSSIHVVPFNNTEDQFIPFDHSGTYKVSHSEVSTSFYAIAVAIEKPEPHLILDWTGTNTRLTISVGLLFHKGWNRGGSHHSAPW